MGIEIGIESTGTGGSGNFGYWRNSRTVWFVSNFQ